MELLVGGCSFTADNQGWQSQLSPMYPIITNLAYPAAGNNYIANVIQDRCLRKHYDMVLVMWSGYSRLDIPSQWRRRRQQNYEWFITTERTGMPVEWMLSGGYNAGWRAAKDDDVREIFQRLYMEMDFQQLAYLTLKNILTTQQLLKSLQQPFRFMSFVNFWDNDRPQQTFQSFYYDDPPISTWPNLQHLVDSIDWRCWIFDSGRNGIYERCIDINDLAEDELHPGCSAQRDWGDKILQHLKGPL